MKVLVTVIILAPKLMKQALLVSVQAVEVSGRVTDCQGVSKGCREVSRGCQGVSRHVSNQGQTSRKPSPLAQFAGSWLGTQN